MRHGKCVVHGCQLPYSGKCGTFDGDQCAYQKMQSKWDAEEAARRAVERIEAAIQNPVNILRQKGDQ